MERKKVLFFIYRLGGGGAARTMLNIINHLDRRQFDPMLVTLDFTYDYETFVKRDVTFIKLPTKRLRASILPLAKLIRTERPDLMFSTVATYNVISSLAKIVSLTSTPLIVREAAYLGMTKKESRMLPIYGFCYRFAKRVVALSEGVRQNLKDNYKVNPTKISVIYNPVDLQHIRHEATTQSIPERLVALLKKNKPIIVTAGRFVKEKDQQTLLRAFSKVNETIPSSLVLLGEGELKEELQTLAENLGIHEDVHFVGFQQNPYVFFYHANLFALSSLTEGFGHVFVEAMATGTPIVTTRCQPGADEVLANGTYGKICPLGNADKMAEKIIEVLTLSKEEHEKVIQRGYKRAEDFAVEKIVKQYEALFLDAMK